MAGIIPFRAVRPAPEVVSRVAALPYDVYNREEARAVVEQEPISFLSIDRPETQFEPDHDMYAQEVYQKAHDMLEERRANGIFLQDEQENYYLYEQTMNGRTQTGIVGCASVDDYVNGVIKKHENTLAEKEADRIRHIDVCDAQTGPIFLCYREQASIREIIDTVKSTQEPVYAFTAVDGTQNRVFVISDRDQVAALKAAFETVPAVYIADGHHRCASAVKVGLERRKQDPNADGKQPYDYFLSVLFPDSELEILDYNRVVRDLNGLTSEAFLEALSGKYTVEKADGRVKPCRKGQVGLYLDGSWYRMDAKPEICSEDAVDGLDVSVLQKQVLDPILGIADPRKDPRIDFVGGIRGLEELERRCSLDMKAAFAMYPTQISELLSVADAGRLMPPKSTWFEPKLLSGLFLHPFH